MCSVVGYSGSVLCRGAVLEGLSRLEYRGYDSAGYAGIVPETNDIVIIKTQGGVQELVAKIAAAGQKPSDAYVGMGHTRWSTHGVPSDINAHPHIDCRSSVAVVHNGIIENYTELKKSLLDAGHHLLSQTDTECIAHVIEQELKTNIGLEQTIISVVNKLQGAYALIIMLAEFPTMLIAVRKSSPLCIGLAQDGTYVASDVAAFADKTQDAIYLPDESFAVLQGASYAVYSFSGERLYPTVQKVSCAWITEGKGDYAHYMLKEIYEQKRVIVDTVAFLRSFLTHGVQQLNITLDDIKNLSAIDFIGCGTSYHAGKIAEFFMRDIADVDSRSYIASEFRYQKFLPRPHCLYFIISQSGETADSLSALRLLNQAEQTTVALSNVASSSMVREATGFLLTQAGQEIAVASTKAFTAQVAALYWLAHWFGVQRGLEPVTALARAEQELFVVAEMLHASIERYKMDIITHVAPKYALYKHWIFLGRHVSYPFAQEAALKLKEITYLFVDCHPAGELKHGSLALIDDQTPGVIFSVLDDTVYQKLYSNAQEIKARSGHIVLFAFEGQHELIALADTVFIFPRVAPLLAPLVMTGLVQFFVYQVATVLGRPIDRPRNLAKSVTVE